MTTSITTDVKELNRRLCNDLWNLANQKSEPSGMSPRLILPVYREDMGIRVSEQESRVLYCNLLSQTNYYFSIETPTEQTYIQTGQTGQSALSDMSIFTYEGESFRKLVNIELKAHNPELEKIRKDFEKIIREGILGNWFHTLRNVDSGTLPSIFTKMKEALKLHSSDILAAGGLSLILCFCVLDKKWACLKVFDYSPTYPQGLNQYVEEFFQLDYRVTQGQILVDNSHGWELLEPR